MDKTAHAGKWSNLNWATTDGPGAAGETRRYSPWGAMNYRPPYTEAARQARPSKSDFRGGNPGCQQGTSSCGEQRRPARVRRNVSFFSQIPCRKQTQDMPINNGVRYPPDSSRGTRPTGMQGSTMAAAPTSTAEKNRDARTKNNDYFRNDGRLCWWRCWLSLPAGLRMRRCIA